MPVTDILNPTTVLTNNAVVSSANALAVKVISGGGSGITIDTSTITGGTTTRLLYDNGGTVGETAAVTYASASVTMAFSSLAILGFMSSASAVDGGFSRIGIATIGFGNGTAADISGKLQGSQIYLGSALTIDGGSGASLEIYNDATTAKARTVASRQNVWDDSRLVNPSGFFIGWASFAAGNVGTDVYNARDTALLRPAAGSLAVVGSTSTITGTILSSNAVLTGTLLYGGVTFASTVTGSGSLVGATNPSVSSLVITGTMTYGGVTYASTVTGTGSNVLATNPTLSSLIATGTVTYGGVTLASTVTGTGSMVLSASPTLSGTASIAAATFSGLATFSSAQTTVGIGTFQNAVAASASVVSTAILFSSTASFGIIWGALGSVAPTLATSQGTLLLNTTGSSVASRMFIRTSSSWSAVTTAA